MKQGQLVYSSISERLVTTAHQWALIFNELDSTATAALRHVEEL